MRLNKIVKEDDLTELFQNYALNVNISGNDNPEEALIFKRRVDIMDQYTKILLTIITVCVVVATLIIWIGYNHDHNDEHDGRP